MAHDKTVSILILLLSLNNIVSSVSLNNGRVPLESLKHYDTTNVTVTYPSRTQRHVLSKYQIQLSSSGHPYEEIHHPSHVYVTFDALGTHFDLELFKNHHILHPLYVERGIDQHSRVLRTRTRKQVKNCHYYGRLRSHPHPSYAIISTCHGVNGYIRMEGVSTVYIRPHDDHTAPAILTASAEHPHVSSYRHVVYRASDANYKDSRKVCGVGHEHKITTTASSDKHHHHQDGPILSVDAILASHSGDGMQLQAPTHCAVSDVVTRYVETHIANDAKRFEQRQLLTEENSLELANGAESFYAASTVDNLCATIHISVKGQTTVISGTDPWETLPGATGTVSSNVLLTRFRSHAQSTADWIGDQNSDYDHAALLSGHKLSNDVVGLAYTNHVCDLDAAMLVQANTDTSQLFDASTVAHELGHNLGMCHDNDERYICGSLDAVTAASCAEGGFVMSYFTELGSPRTHFSLCSNEDLKSSLDEGDKGCIENVPAATWAETGMCGNGFREGSEECDCGPTVDCATAPLPFTDICCDTSCLLKAGKVCSNLQPCCENCDIVRDGRVCRSSRDAVLHSAKCDLEEVCDNESADCPADTYQLSCGDSIQDRIAQWFKDNWKSMLVGLVFFLLLVFLYFFVSAFWDFCCDPRENEQDEVKFARSGFVGKLRGSMVYRVKTKRRERLRRLQQRGGGVGKFRGVAGIALPNWWGVRYTPEGVPIYLNHESGERFDFREGPPTLQQQQFRVEMTEIAREQADAYL